MHDAMNVQPTTGKGQRVAIMQPYFLPYLGYISLIKHTDRFILFDPVQFIRHGWIERNRILKQGGGWLYVRVPLLPHGRDTLIKDIRIDNSRDWRRSLFSQLDVYKRIAPNYGAVVALLRHALTDEHDDIVALDRALLQAICDYLDIDRTLEVFSELELSVAPVTSPDEWALNTCLALGNVAEYWNAPGGRDFFDASKYANAGIDLKFQAVTLRPYNQDHRDFEPGMSIIDVLMFNSPEQVHAMLDDFVLLDGVDRSPHT